MVYSIILKSLTTMQCDTHSVKFTVHGTMLTIKDSIMQCD